MSNIIRGVLIVAIIILIFYVTGAGESFTVQGARLATNQMFDALEKRLSGRDQFVGANTMWAGYMNPSVLPHY